MIDELRALAVFAKTVECGSFRAAAKALNLSPSVVSHHVSALEQRLAVALLYRSTRHLSLTSEGELLHASARAMLAAAEQGLDGISGRSRQPFGQLRLTLPAFFSRSDLVARIAAFAREFPRVTLRVDFSDQPRDLIREGIDLAIRVGDLKDSGLKSTRLFDLKRTLVASPDVVAAHRKPKHPGDLGEWDWIGLSMRADAKRFADRKGQPAEVEFTPRVVVDSVDAACQFAVAGLGLASPPAFLAQPEIAAGRLVEVLPAWQVTSLGVYALWPANASGDSLTRRFVAFLAASAARDGSRRIPLQVRRARVP
jgi:DNA-binding transcriptional LysR family regulator